MLSSVYEFWGSRDLNKFLKGHRKLEKERNPEVQTQPNYWVVKDLNSFLKGSRKLEPILCPPIDMVQQKNNDVALQPSPLNTQNNEMKPFQQQLIVSRPVPPRIPGIRQNMSIFVYGVFPVVHILLSILRMIWLWIEFLPLECIYLDLFYGLLRNILIYLSWVIFIVGAIFIAFDFQLDFYKRTIIILAISILFDVAGLLCSTIQFGIYAASTEEQCSTQYLAATEGYYYELDYPILEQRSLEICVTYQNLTEYSWLIVFLVASFFIYCDFVVLMYQTSKVQPRQSRPPEQQYQLEQPPLNRNIEQQ